MNYKEVIESLDKEGFLWSKFRDYFPFGDVSLREGNFQKLVLTIMNQLDGNDQKELLLDMLDTQNCIFLEQVWLQNEQYENEAESPFHTYGHFISAQLQITSNIRSNLDLKRKDPRAAMLRISESEMLLDRILARHK